MKQRSRLIQKYTKFLQKCKEPNRKYYHSKQMRIEDELTNPTIVEILKKIL
jgi:hypothetical protein